ncbi:hypothetical protein HID58_054825, partial [Brassica napus]
MPPIGGLAIASDPGVGDTQSSTASSPVRPTMQSRSYLKSSDNIKEVEETQTSKEEVEIQKPATDAAIDAAFDTVSGDGDATVTASSDNIKEVEETQTSKEEVDIQKPATDAAIDAAFDTVSGDGDATVTAVSEATDTICTEKEACPNENEWITPTKVGKTLEKNEEQNLGPISLLAKSPFAALALEEEEGEIVGQSEAEKDIQTSVEAEDIQELE